MKLQLLTDLNYSKEQPTFKNCDFPGLHFFNCTSTVISLHIFAVHINPLNMWWKSEQQWQGGPLDFLKMILIQNKSYVHVFTLPSSLIVVLWFRSMILLRVRVDPGGAHLVFIYIWWYVFQFICLPLSTICLISS